MKDPIKRLSKGDLVVHVRTDLSYGKKSLAEKGIVKYIKPEKSVGYYSINSILGIEYTNKLNDKFLLNQSWIKPAAREILDLPPKMNNYRKKFDFTERMSHEEAIQSKINDIRNESPIEKKVEYYLKYHRTRFCPYDQRYRIIRTLPSQLTDNELKILKELKNQL